MNFEIKFTENALEDIQEMKFYISYNLKNPEAAITTLERIMSSIEKLKTFPKIHRVRRKNSGKEIRVVPVENFNILYFLDNENNAVNILRVLYGRRNIDALP